MTKLTAIAALLLSYSLFVFNPLFIYFSDTERLGTLPFPYLIRITVIASVLAVVLTVPHRILGRRYSLAICFLCLTVFLYSYVMQFNFGLFRGNRFADEQLIDTAARSAYFIEPIALAVLFLLLRMVFDLKKIILSTVFAALFLSLSFNLGAMAFESRKSESRRAVSNSKPVAVEKVFRFSKSQRNIVLVIPDAGSGDVLSDVMKQGTRGSQFSGFTNFRNTVSVGSYTMPSTAALMAGERYFPDVINARNDRTILEHINEAYNWLADTLNDHGYQSRFVGPKFVGCGEIRQAAFCAESKRFKGLLEERFSFETVPVFAEKLLRYFAVFKTVPYSLKPFVYRSAAWKDAVEGAEQLATSVNNRYFEYLMLRALPDMSIASQAEPSQFNLLWNSELIAPMNLARDCQPLVTGRAAMYSEETRVDSTRCVIDALSSWFQWMKENGVYDNTKIIIASDHGAGRPHEPWFKRAVNPILMVKDFDGSGPLQISDTLMQNSDVPALICSALGGCEEIEKDPSKFPVADRVARYFHTTHGNASFARQSRSFEIMKVFEIRGNLKDHPAF